MWHFKRHNFSGIPLVVSPRIFFEPRRSPSGSEIPERDISEDFFELPPDVSSVFPVIFFGIYLEISFSISP